MNTSHVHTIAIYKGRKYKLLWEGQGKYGPCAKLGFFDGTSEFFVKQGTYEKAAESSGPDSGQRRRRGFSSRSRYLCPACGNPADGGPGAPGYMCGEPCGD